MRLWINLLALLMAAFLTACGGGGGAPGLTSGSAPPAVVVPVIPPLFTTAPSALNVENGGTSVAYAVSGGVPPYKVASDTPALVNASIDTTAATVVITATAGKYGTGSITITDAAGTKVPLSVSVPAPSAVWTNAPTSFSLSIGTSNFITVYGGSKIVAGQSYVVNNSDPTVVSTNISGSTLTVTGRATGQAVVAISDPVGTLHLLNVTVPQPSALFTDAPGSMVLAKGTRVDYGVFGGVPMTGQPADYRLNNMVPSVADAAMVGSTLTITAKAVGNTTLTISDKVGTRISLTLTVSAADALLTTAPANLTLVSIQPSDTYTISGGVPNATAPKYNITSTNKSLVTVTPTADATQFTIAATAGSKGGSALVEVTDSIGGKVTITVTVPPPVALFTTAPAALAMPKPTGGASDSLTYSIAGGVGPYSVVSSSSGVVKVTAPLAPATTLGSYTLTSVSGGAATIEISDSVGTKITVVATVPAAPALFSDAPANVTVPVTVALATGYPVTLTGGVPISASAPYTALSSNEAVATVVPDGATAGKFNIKGVAPGATAITFKDASGTAITVSVTVPAPDALYSDSPNNLVLAIGSTQLTDVYGGTQFSVSPKYAVNNSNNSVVTTSLNGSKLTIVGKAAGSATVLVSDAKGNTLSFNLTVPAPNAIFTDGSSNLTLAKDTSSSLYTIYGGVPDSSGKYTITSNNPSVALVCVTCLTTGSVEAPSQTVTGPAFTIRGVSIGSTTLTITDSVGTKATIGVTVAPTGALLTTAPSNLTRGIGEPAAETFSVYGGVSNASGPKYNITSTNKSLVTVTPNLDATQFTIAATAGSKGGTADVVITDSIGGKVTITVTVPAPVALFTTAPASLAIASGGTARSFAIFGGRSPYTVVNANPAVASGAVTGSTLDILGATPGSTTIYVSDALGATVTIGVTVTSPGPLFTSAQSSLTIAKDLSDTFAINGGMPGYSVTSSNNSVARVSMVGATGFKIEALAAGSTTVVVTDALNTTISIVVTVPAPGVLYTTAPNVLNITRSTSPYSFAIKGGYPLYAASSSDTGVVTVGVSVDAVGNATLNITGVNGGAATLTVRDSQAQELTIQVTVASSTPLFSNAPATVQMASSGVYSVLTYLVNGGSAVENGAAGGGSYHVRSSNPAVLDASMVGPVLTVTGKASGSATIRVTDAMSKFLDITFNVSSSSGSTSSLNYPSLSSELQTTVGVVTNSIDATGYTLLKVTMKDPSGVAIPNQVISVTADATKLSFPEGNAALTNSSGVATIKIARASLLATGAGAITIDYDYKPGMIGSYSGGGAAPTAASLINSYVGYQVTTAQVTLDPINLGSGSLAAYGTRQVSVLAKINTVAATSTPVTVSFSATCGQISPATASTDSTGTVLVTYSATDTTGTSPSTLGCSGKTVQITASSSGAAAVTGSLTVSAAPATSMSFVSAAPTRIYLANSGGVNQSLLTFQLLNQLGEGIQNQAVQLTMRSLTGGTPKAAFDTSGSISPVTLTTDSAGKVTQAVYAGAVPTSVVVNAALVATPTIQTDSFVLAVASGRPVQSRLSMTIEKWAIEGFSLDGMTTNVSLNLSDRQGNPVPDGTAVNFVTEGGVMIPPTCVTGTVAGDSRCSVTIRSQGTRPSDGLVTIMAYASGEEDFVDANGNNTYDCGETFLPNDLGLAYRDDTMTSTVVNAYVAGQFSVPRAAASSSCPGASPVAPTVSAGDGVWGAADVRKQQVIVFATSAAAITASSVSTSVLSYRVADLNGNSMPTGTTISVTVADNTSTNSLTCAVASGGSVAVSNALGAMTPKAFFTNCASNDVFIVTVTSPLGTVSSNSFTVP